MAAATERESYQAASTTKRFDYWRSFEGNPGKMSRCLTDPKFYDLLFFFSFFNPSERPGKDQISK